MQTSEFIEKLKTALEIEDREIDEQTDLRSLEEYDSLSVLALIAMIDENFGKKIPGERFRQITTVQSLMECIGLEHFE